MREAPEVDVACRVIVAGGEARGQDGLASKPGEVACAGDLAPGVGKAADVGGLIFRPVAAWEDVDEDAEAEDDILHGT